MERIAREKAATWQSNRGNSATVSTKPAARKPASRARDMAAPEFVPPMRATLVEKLPQGAEWLYEIKWDGYRALGLKHYDRVKLLSLKNKDLTGDFPAVAEALQQLQVNSALLDGEIVAVNDKGRPSFQALQNRAGLGREWHVVYYVFDLLELEGEDLKRLTLVQRKEQLRKVIADSAIRFSAALPGSTADIVRAVETAGLEGVVAKRKDSVYSGRTRSLAWRKMKLAAHQEFVIGGYNPDSDKFSSLLVGYYEGKELLFAGKVRQGFNPASRSRLMKKLRPLRQKHCPFSNLPTSKTGHFGEGITAEDMKKLQWLRPALVAQVSFTEWTSYGLLRHARFMGLREDKAPREVLKETPSGF